MSLVSGNLYLIVVTLLVHFGLKRNCRLQIIAKILTGFKDNGCSSL